MAFDHSDNEKSPEDSQKVFFYLPLQPPHDAHFLSCDRRLHEENGNFEPPVRLTFRDITFLKTMGAKFQCVV